MSFTASRLTCRISVVIPLFWFVFAPILAAQPGQEGFDQRHLQILAKEIDRFTAMAGGRVGVGALHLQSGRAVYHNPGESFPMASAYKVPIAAQLLHRVDRGEVRLDRMLTLSASDLRPGSGTLSDLFARPGVSLSLLNLLELMLVISDNSATDLLLKEAGGPGDVTARMRALGVDSIRVDRPTAVLIADWAGIRSQLPSEGEWSRDLFLELIRQTSASQRQAASQAFDRDPRDTSTPRAMVLLLEKLWKGEALSRQRTDLLLEIMRRCRTGGGRIKGLLPPFVEVAHKTGTIGGSANDVGIVTLPEGGGDIALAIFVKESKRPVEDREAATAQIARAVYDFFLFHPAPQN